MSRGRRIAWFLLVAWIGLTVVTMTIPVGDAPPFFGPGFDKVVHTGLFTVMGVLAQTVAPWVTLVLTVPLAIAMELVQKRLPHRSFDRVDLIANVLGVLIGVGCYEVATRLGEAMSDAKQQRPKGTLDFLPPVSEQRAAVAEVFGTLARRRGFREIVTPTFEHTEVFVKSSGDTSDIVTKEMYTFADRADRSLTLRPEGTPGIVRAVLENRYRVPCRLYAVGSYFRYGRPQKGRHREFGQLSVEALGEAGGWTDAEIVALGAEFFSELGIADCTTELNSIGCRECRPPFREKLVEFLTGKREALCEECQARLERNPLRIFDCKNPGCNEAVKDAPVPRDHLCAACAEHFGEVRRALERRKVHFTLNDRLVRGLDYYNRTVFEYVSGRLGAQDSLGGGGRYDYLVEQFGGPSTPAAGFALGFERTMLAMPAFTTGGRRPLAFVVAMSEDEFDAAVGVLDKLRSQGVAAQMDFDAKNPRRQFKSADAAEAACCVIVGPDEMKRGGFSVKNLVTGEQSMVPGQQIVDAVRAQF